MIWNMFLTTYWITCDCSRECLGINGLWLCGITLWSRSNLDRFINHMWSLSKLGTYVRDMHAPKASTAKANRTCKYSVLGFGCCKVFATPEPCPETYKVLPDFRVMQLRGLQVPNHVPKRVFLRCFQSWVFKPIGSNRKPNAFFHNLHWNPSSLTFKSLFFFSSKDSFIE